MLIKLIFISIISIIISEKMRSGNSTLKPAAENATVMEAEKLVEVKARVPERVAKFIRYASRRLSIPEEELTAKLIGDALCSLESYMSHPEGWTGFVELSLEPVLDNALANLAMAFMGSYDSADFQHLLEFEERHWKRRRK